MAKGLTNPLLRLWRGRLVAVLVGILGFLACSSEPQDTPLSFWVLGGEGVAVRPLVEAFQRENPDVRVIVQQIPWRAAHEKLLTAYAGDAMPDVFAVGNTWVPEFDALAAVEPLMLSAREKEDFFSGILDSSTVHGRLMAMPWYIDTRLLFYRRDLLLDAGFEAPPTTWSEWLLMMETLRERNSGSFKALIAPLGEWQLPVILGMQSGASLLDAEGCFGRFQAASFRAAFHFYIELYDKGLAPLMGDAQMTSLYQDFAGGHIAFYVTGPWNIGEFHRRLPPSLEGVWATAVMPGPTGPGASLAGGSSLAVSSSSRHKEKALALVEFMVRPQSLLTLYRETGDLPPKRSVWSDPLLLASPPLIAFRRQLDEVIATPKVPEWEQIASKIILYAERSARHEMTEEEALLGLDRDVDRLLSKRRWLFSGDCDQGRTP